MKKKYLLFICLSIFTGITSLGQNCIKKEIKIDYQNGREIFTICDNNPSVVFLSNIDYYWYNDYSGLKSTKGDSGGKLLNGEYKFYAKTGEMKLSENYVMGVKEGLHKEWDSMGNLTSVTKYLNGKSLSYKYYSKNGYAEHTGEIGHSGWKKKSYDASGTLTSIQEMIGENVVIKTYNKHLVLISDELYKDVLLSCLLKIRVFYDNGKLKVTGNFYDKYYKPMKIGEWIFYDEKGEPNGVDMYKVEEEFFPNGNIKIRSNYIFSTERNLWEKDGYSEHYTEKGNIEYVYKYEWGKIIDEGKWIK